MRPVLQAIKTIKKIAGFAARESWPIKFNERAICKLVHVNRTHLSGALQVHSLSAHNATIVHLTRTKLHFKWTLN